MKSYFLFVAFGLAIQASRRATPEAARADRRPRMAALAQNRRALGLTGCTLFCLIGALSRLAAGLAELVDALDSKSSSSECGFESHSRYEADVSRCGASAFFMARSDANAAEKRSPGTKPARKQHENERVPRCRKPSPARRGRAGALQHARPEFLLGYVTEIIRALIVRGVFRKGPKGVFPLVHG